VFSVTSTGTAAARNWAFLSSANTNNIITRKIDASNQYVCDGEIITAPSNASYAVFNANKNNEFVVYKGKSLDRVIDDKISELGVPIATSNIAAIAIPSNADFNTYVTPGNYKVTAFAIAQTVSNIPVVLAGRLIVLTTTANSSPVQIYIANNASCYIRIKVGDDWRTWKALTDEGSAFVLNTLSATVIADGTDIDTLRAPGNYKVENISSANTMLNLP
jgi:hypothetical protein